MTKKITINNVSVELSKKDLEKALKEFDKPVYELMKNGTLIILYKNGEREGVIGRTDYETSACNFNTLARDMANLMGDLMPMEERLDRIVNGYSLVYDVDYEEIMPIESQDFIDRKLFKTEELRDIAKHLLKKWLDDGKAIFGIKRESE